jgi:hypothetical protein
MRVPAIGGEKQEHRPTVLLHIVQPSRLDGAITIVSGAVEGVFFAFGNPSDEHFVPNHLTGVDR